MNKGSKIKFLGGLEHFHKDRLYTILAGQGDGVPRNDGKLGAFIQNDREFVVEDDRGILRNLAWNEFSWLMVKEASSNYVPKPGYKNPIQQTTSLC